MLSEHFEVFTLELDLGGQRMSAADLREFSRQIQYWDERAAELHERNRQSEIDAILTEADL